LAIADHKIEPPLAGIDDDGARPVIAGIVHGGARHRRYAHAEEAAERVGGLDRVVEIARFGRRRGRVGGQRKLRR
jgi:hypothetical protein